MDINIITIKMKGYSVSLFYRKVKDSVIGGTHTSTTSERLWGKIYDAVSKEEALGKAIIESKELFKDFALEYHLVIEFEINDDDKNKI